MAYKIILLTGLICFWIARSQTGKRDKYNTGLWDYSWILGTFTIVLWCVMSVIEVCLWLVFIALDYV